MDFSFEDLRLFIHFIAFEWIKMTNEIDSWYIPISLEDPILIIYSDSSEWIRTTNETDFW